MILSLCIHWAIILFFSPLLLGIIGKIKAFFAGRWGSPLLQSYYDLAKLFRKNCVYSVTTTWIFRGAPIVSMAAILTAGTFIPMGALKAPVQFWGDALLFASLLALARFFMVLAALDTGSSFEGMGASREMTFSCIAELTLFLNFVVLALFSRSFSLSEMIAGNASYSWQFVGPVLLLVVVSYFLILLVETSRIPVDDPNTHLELTMIHEVMVLDHSGPDFGFILYGSAIKLFILGSLWVSLVTPFQTQYPWMNMLLFASGMIGLAVVIGIIESGMARLRLNRVPYLLIGTFVLALLGFIIALMRGH